MITTLPPMKRPTTHDEQAIMTLLLSVTEASRGHRGQTIEEFTLRFIHARFFTPTRLPLSIKRGKMGFCFRNAYELVSERSDLTYVEGFAVGCLIPVHHAWTVDDRGNVIDPTWDGSAYMGIPLRLDIVEQRIIAREAYGVFDGYGPQDQQLMRMDAAQLTDPRFIVPTLSLVRDLTEQPSRARTSKRRNHPTTTLRRATHS